MIRAQQGKMSVRYTWEQTGHERFISVIGTDYPYCQSATLLIDLRKLSGSIKNTHQIENGSEIYEWMQFSIDKKSTWTYLLGGLEINATLPLINRASWNEKSAPANRNNFVKPIIENHLLAPCEIRYPVRDAILCTMITWEAQPALRLPVDNAI